MKKLLSLIITVALCLSMSACFSDNAQSEKKPQQTDEATATAQANDVFGLNETAVFDKLKFTAVELKESNGTGFFKPESGNVFVGIKFSVENTSNEEQTVSSLLLFDGYADDIKCKYSLNAVCAFDEGTLDGKIAPGKKAVGWYALEIPESWSAIELNVKSDWLSNGTAKFLFTKQ